MSIDYKLIGKRIQQKRIAMGQTQEHLAEYMDISVGYVSQLERGTTKISLDRLAVISDYLGCTIADLVEGTSQGNSFYMANELQVIYSQLSSTEKKLVFELLKTYLKEKP